MTRFYLVGDYPGGRPVAYSEHNGEAVKGGRPVVVIDPEDHESTDRLDSLYQRHLDEAPSHCSLSEVMQATLREFANPKPEEPTGLGAVVESSTGVRWVSLGSTFANGETRWQNPRTCMFSKYADLDIVNVLSKGVTP